MQDDSNKDAPKANNGRRDFLNKSAKTLMGAGLAGAGIGQAMAMGSTQNLDAVVPPDYSTLKYSDNNWNRDAMARLLGDLDFGKEKFGWYKGTVIGVKPGHKNLDLCGFEGFSFTRLLDNGDGTYQKLLREVGFYTDLKTGEVIEEWHNPYLDEKVKVVHIANDPFNRVITAFRPKPPAYGGLNPEDFPDIPYILPWQDVGNNKVLLQTYIHLFYKNALDPEKWVRESSGEKNRVTEMFNYVIDREDLANPDMTSVQFSGSWSRITPWLPWMLMGQGEGHVNYNCVMGCYDNMDMVSPQVIAYAKKHYPTYFEAPTVWEEPSWSSLEHFANDQEPVPVKGS